MLAGRNHDLESPHGSKEFISVPNTKILVVDDMPDIRMEVQCLLQAKYDVSVAESGEEALTLCHERGPFAVVLSDQGMPGMTGTELLARMRVEHPDTVRIMMSGYADLELAIGALKDGALFRFMQKPFRPQGLIDMVQAGVERFQFIDEQRFVTKQLEFSRSSLLSLTESLERRLSDQLGRMRGLQRLCLSLSEANSLWDVAERTARGCSKLLGGRDVEVCLMDKFAQSTICSKAGAALEGAIEQVPITAAEGQVGEIRLALGSGGALGEADNELLASISSTAAISAHFHLSRQSLDLAHDATIFALSSLAEKRDDETGKHLHRMGMYCELIAKTLRGAGRHTAVLSDAYIRRLVASAPLHDVGKVGIPESILMKPGPLDAAEWEVMRTHAEIGAHTIRRVFEATGEKDFLRMGHDIAWAHHERWDGKGYPRGLSGAETPLSARIVGAADCYDSLTSWRPYKEPWSHREALAYISEGSGSQFDPEIVVAVQECAKAMNHIRESMADTDEELRAKRAA